MFCCLKVIVSKYFHEELIHIVSSGKFLKKEQGSRNVEILTNDGVILDFFYYHYIREGTDVEPNNKYLKLPIKEML